MHALHIVMHTRFFTQYSGQNRGVMYGLGFNQLNLQKLQIGAGLEKLILHTRPRLQK